MVWRPYRIAGTRTYSHQENPTRKQDRHCLVVRRRFHGRETALKARSRFDAVTAATRQCRFERRTRRRTNSEWQVDARAGERCGQLSRDDHGRLAHRRAEAQTSRTRATPEVKVD